MRIAVTGKEGQVVQALLSLGASKDIDVIPLGRPELDLARPETIFAAIASADPDVVVSVAAYTAVDKAESEPDLVYAINGQGAGLVAEAAARLGKPVIQLSTDYVFDGLKSEPYREDDPTGPVSVYGRSKLEGERLVAHANRAHVILRTAWVYSPFGTNFVKTMLRLGETHDRVRVVDDQKGCPTSALDIAEAILLIAEKLVIHPQNENYGIFHLTGSGQASWADFADFIFVEQALLGGKSVKVERISTRDYPTAARRPSNSTLCGDKLDKAFGIRLNDWKLSTKAVLKEIWEGGSAKQKS
jgi:dTDP-4-dehydrorhamnose reductase